ncbi:hypothetical protein M770_20290 [Pseudomonas aeruginosa VRFPA03]|nr:hypothetical protein M770_20290 [Pseudomonas aeruginosa VRFPA03]
MRNVMLITGASRGIGAATALLAAERGYAVVLNYLRNREAAEALCSPPSAAMRSSSTICATARPPKRCASASSARAAKPWRWRPT